MRRKSFWQWLRDNSGAIQAIASVVGVTAIGISLWAARIELQRFQLDYGPQAELVMSGSRLKVKMNNWYVRDFRTTVIPYLQLSEKQYEKKNPQYIQLTNYYECFSVLYGQYGEYSECVDTPAGKRPRWPKMFDQLAIIFNESPQKLYPSIVCISTLEFTNAKGDFEKHYYVTEECDPGPYDFPRHYRVHEEQLAILFPQEKVIGTIDFGNAGMLGFGNPLVSRQVMNLVARHRWKQRFIEHPLTREWRLNSVLFGDVTLKELREAKVWDRTNENRYWNFR